MRRMTWLRLRLISAPRSSEGRSKSFRARKSLRKLFMIKSLRLIDGCATSKTKIESSSTVKTRSCSRSRTYSGKVSASHCLSRRKVAKVVLLHRLRAKAAGQCSETHRVEISHEHQPRAEPLSLKMAASQI